MPVSLENRTEFIERYLVDEFDRPLHVRPWMKSHVLEPLDGYQSWRAGERLCSSCKILVARICSTLAACKIAPHSGCDGVDGHKIIIALLNLKRQQGKTTTAAVYSLSELFLARNSNILYLAAAEKQSGRIFEAKWVAPIRKNPKLLRKVSINGDEIRNERRGNLFKFVPTSAKSVPGGTWRFLIVDEGRDVKAPVIAALVPSIIAARGLECPYGHFTSESSATTRQDCPACGTILEEWYGRILVMSSSGEDTGWFFEMIDLLEEVPQPNSYLYRSAETLNAHTSEETITAIEETFGKLPSMEGLIRRELHNEFTREGDEFLPAKAIKAITSEALVEVQASTQRCVGFLDCSRTAELTSLVLAGDPNSDGEGASVHPPFEKISILRVDVWDPKTSPGGRVSYTQIRDHIAAMLGTAPLRFPNLVELAIDTTLLSDAKELFDWCRRQPWGGRVREFQADRLANQLAWQHLEQRVLGGAERIEIPNHKRLVDELKSARVRTTTEGFARVMDSSAGDRRGGRLHRDISMALAGCCFLAAKYGARAADKSSTVAQAINASLTLQSKFKPITTKIGKNKW